MWSRVQEAVSEVHDHTTLKDMVDEERLKWSRYVPDYTI